MARRPIEGKVSDDTIYSEELQTEIPLLVYTPPHFSPFSSYDVLICQDGNDYFQIGRIPRVVEELIDDVCIRETIAVGIPYPSVKTRRKWYHPDGELMHAYIRFLTTELLPYIQKTYPIKEESNGRTLAGDSLAATISLLTALKHPTLFGQVMMHSPYVDDYVLQTIDNCESPESLSLYHVVGKEETNVDTIDGILDFLTPNRAMNEKIASLPFTYTYDEFDGDHTWKYWQPDLKRGLQTLIPF